MADFRLLVICFLAVIQDSYTQISEVESQLLGYEEMPRETLHTDDVTTGRTVITDPSWLFPSDAILTAFNVRLHGNALGNNVSLQIWRPRRATTGGDTKYSLVISNSNVDTTTTGHQRVVLAVPQKIQRGDVIGLYSPGQNPIPFHLPTGECDNRTMGYLFVNGTGGEDVTFENGGECRHYLLTAEYMFEDLGLTMNILGDDVKFRTETDTKPSSIIMPYGSQGFPTEGTLYGWKAYLELPHEQVVFQVWRPTNTSEPTSTVYTKLHESPPYSQPVHGAVHVRLRQTERSEVIRGDVIALSFSGRNPVPYDWSVKCEDGHLRANRSEAGVQEVEFTSVTGDRACRKYSFQAEYYRAPSVMPSPPMDTESSNSSLPDNSTSSATPTSAETTPTQATPTTIGTPDSTEATPTSGEPIQGEFGWDVTRANGADGVTSGTIVPDVGRGFPADGKVIGWVFNVSRKDRKISLQVWRPMPEHPLLTPHARDFAYVGGFKSIRPFHVGENRFTFDQIGEAPFPVRKGDVIAIRVEATNTIPYTPSTGCAGRYYMDHYGDYSACAQYIMQRTAVCRIYPIKAIVIWDEDNGGKKAPDCVDQTASLVPSPPPAPTKKTHIDGCLILSIKSTDATYQLTNPDYPNITKHRDLCWVIHLEPAMYADLYIQIKINDLDLRVPKECNNYASDFLEFRDGEWATSSLLKRYCVGWAAGSDNDIVTQTDVITACHHFLYLRLRTSRESYGFKGFKLHYQAVEKSSDGTMCTRPLWPAPVTSAARGRNAAIITIVVVVIVIAAVCLLAYVRKRGFKPPQWMAGHFFRHRLFHNQEAPLGAGGDSPRHHHSTLNNPDLQPHSNGGLPGGGMGGPGSNMEGSGYVTFVPGGYPSNGEPVLQLGKLAARPSTNANDSAVMEGITDNDEAIASTNGWSQDGNRSTNRGQDNNASQFHFDTNNPLNGDSRNNNNTSDPNFFNAFDNSSSIT